jgi:SAM-dependent methyltransferase
MSFLRHSRERSVAEVCGAALVQRYKQHYRIRDDAPVTEEMVLRHWMLERRLTGDLISSDPGRRWEVFEHCYTTLYSELRWLNDLVDTARTIAPPVDEAEDWTRLIGPPPKRVYEIGSGKGRLIAQLAGRGYDCTATEITRERGEKWTGTPKPVRWTVSDGIHLDRFEPPESYDAVISDQVIEHFHPDDLAAHFRGAYAILKPGGRYAFATPHAFEGPFDVSRVFGSHRPEGMHLREYTYTELLAVLHAAGFARIAASFHFPHRVRSRFRGWPHPMPSRAYCKYLRGIERALAWLPPRARRPAARALRSASWTSGITLVATKL